MKKLILITILMLFSFAMISMVSAATINVPTDYATIQAAINAASSGDIIQVAAGTYTEKVDVTKGVTITGAGSTAGGTIVTNGVTNGNVFTIRSSGVSLKNILIQARNLNSPQDAGRYAGIAILGSLSNLNIDSVAVTGEDLCIDYKNVGLQVGDGQNISGLTITNSRFEDLAVGLYLYNSAASYKGSYVRDVTITNTIINSNVGKGIYAEKLSDATFTDVTVTNNGDGTKGCSATFAPSFAGFDINLKFGNYQNLIFNNLIVTGNGLGAKNGVGIGIKARSDGATYGANPATLNNVQVNGGTFSGNERGILIGEPAKLGAGPTNVVIKNANIYSNVKTYAGTDGSLYGGVINQVLALIDARNNYWGSASGPGNTAVSYPGAGSIMIDPWLCEPYPTNWVTIGGICLPKCTPTGVSEASCNGIDDDCDEAIDEDYSNIQTSCGIGVCSATGQMVCNAGLESNTCNAGTPTTEVCGNGLDEDCNGVADNGCCAQVIEGLQLGDTKLKAIDNKCCVKSVNGLWTYDNPTSDEDSHGDYLSCVVIESKIQGFTGKSIPNKGDIAQTAAQSNVNMPEASNSPTGLTGFAILDTKGIGFFCYNFGWFC